MNSFWLDDLVGGMRKDDVESKFCETLKFCEDIFIV